MFFVEHGLCHAKILGRISSPSCSTRGGCSEPAGLSCTIRRGVLTRGKYLVASICLVVLSVSMSFVEHENVTL
jgi:hypothetical protein